MPIKKSVKKTMLIAIVLLTAWVVFAQSCMKFRISDSKAQRQFAAAGVPLHTATFNSNGFPLHYARTGADTLPTLFFLHGSPGSWEAFSGYLKDSGLLQHYRMFSVDRPGFGYSRFGDARNLAEQSALISPLLRHVQNGRPVYLVGHSLGGPLAVKLGADNPDLVQGLVLLAASVSPALEPREKWRGLALHSPLQWLLPGAFRPSNREIWYLKKDLVPLAADFARIRCRVWIVHGDKDKFVPVGNAAYAQQMLVNAAGVDTTILPGASHFIPWPPWYKDVKQVLMGLKVE